MAAAAIYTSIPQDMVNFVYREPSVNKYKSKTSYVNKSRDDSSRPRYQFAAKDDQRLRAPYGISKPFDEKQQESDRKSLDMTIESDSLLEVLKALDQHHGFLFGHHQLAIPNIYYYHLIPPNICYEPPINP